MILENNGQLQEMPVSEIYEVKVRKFSILKSTGLLGATYAAIIAGILIAIIASGGGLVIM